MTKLTPDRVKIVTLCTSCQKFRRIEKQVILKGSFGVRKTIGKRRGLMYFDNT